jgi:predicted ATPase
VWFVDLSILAPTSPVSDVWRSIATAIGAHADSALSARESALGLLQGRQALVVLDNCEHVLDATADVIDDLTATAPTVTVLATSRETLALDGEHVHRLPPLSSEGVDSPAIRLFVDRAVACDPTFLSDRSELDTVAALCARLEGSPLAIELAASRVTVLRPSDILANIDDRLAILRSRRGRGRQTSLRATVEWSYSLLDPDEQAALRRLAVFDGSFDAAAAEAVVGLDTRSEVLDVLESAAAKSLLVVEPWSETLGARFSLLDTIRAFGLERLADAGEEADTRERAASHYHVSLLEELADDPFVVASLGRRPRLVADWPGYLAALDWWHGNGAHAPRADTRLAELASAISYPWKDAGDQERFFTYVGLALEEQSLDPWLASIAHAMYAVTSANALQPDAVMRVMQAVQFAHETPNDMAAFPLVATGLLVSAIGWNDLALDAGDAALRCAVDSRYASILVPTAHGARGVALLGARRFEEAAGELDAAMRLPEGHPDDYDFLARYAVALLICRHLLGDHEAALAAADRLAARYANLRLVEESLFLTMMRVVATCPFDPAAARRMLHDLLGHVRSASIDRSALVPLALLELYDGNAGSAAELLAMCDAPLVFSPLVWEYRHRLEGWPSRELDERRTAAAARYMDDPPEASVLSAPIDAFMARGA